MITKEDFIIAIEKQLSIAGYDIKYPHLQKMSDRMNELDNKALNGEKIDMEEYNNNKWFHIYTITQEQEKDFKEWLRIFLKTNYKKEVSNKQQLEKYINYFILNYGLRCQEKKN